MAYRQGSRRPVYEHRYELEESKGRIDDFVYLLAWLLTMTVNGFRETSIRLARKTNLTLIASSPVINCIVLI